MDANSKKTVRQGVRAEIAKLSESAKQHLSEQILHRILQCRAIQEATTVALFVSLHDEPMTASIIAELVQSKCVVIPRIEGDEMNFYDISKGVHKGSFGIMEPTDATPIEPCDIDVMIVPGVAFTREGARLGRGKGFYDKYLSRSGFRAHTIGICYPCQVVEELPIEGHDKVMNEMIF